MSTVSNEAAPRSPNNLRAETASLSSQISLGLDNGGSDRASMGTNRLYDVVQVALVCRQHRAMLFADVFNSLYYFPFSTLKPAETAHSGFHAKLKDLLTRLSLNKSNLLDGVLVDLLHIQIPPRNEYICRYTFRVEERKDKENTCICRSAAKGYVWEKWVEPNGFHAKVGKFWAIEPVLMLDKILGQSPVKESVLQEITLDEMTKYLSEEVLMGEHPLSVLLTKLDYKPDDLYRCFLDYLNTTYPSIYMNRLSMHDWLVRSALLQYVYLPDRLLPAFQIDPSKDAALGYIDFDEFLFGMLFIDIDCPHQSPFADIRLSYIFRYYKRGRPTLEFDDILSICKDIEAVIFKPTGAGVSTSKKKYQIEAEAFWKETKAEKSTGLGWTPFQATCQKAVSKTLKYLNMENVLRTQKSLLAFEQQSDQLARVNLGRDFVDIYSKRNVICGQCEQKELCKWAEHTIKVDYAGNIVDVIDNDKWVTDPKLRTNKARRRTSKLFFSEDYFPGTVFELLCTFGDSMTAGGGGGGGVRKAKSAVCGGNNKPDKPTNQLQWGTQFVCRNMDRLIDMVSEATAGVTDTELSRLASPCALCPDFVRFTDLITMERNLSHLPPLAHPLRYVFLLTADDLGPNKNGLELCLYLASRRLLVPDKFCPVLAAFDGKRRDSVRSSLTKQLDAIVNKEVTDLIRDKLVEALLKLLDKFCRCALIDESVCVLSGVEANENSELCEAVDNCLANFDFSNGTRGRKKKAAKKEKVKKETSVVSQCEASNTNSGGASKFAFTIFSTETKPKKVLIRTVDDQLLPIGEDKAIPKEAHLVILVETQKIRPLYLTK